MTDIVKVVKSWLENLLIDEDREIYHAMTPGQQRVVRFALRYPGAMREAKQQVIVCAAMRNKHGSVICSPRHWDSAARDAAWAQTSCPHSTWEKAEQGFVDQYGTFLTREEAWSIAEKAGQIVRRCGGDGVKLFSENLY